MAERGVSYEVGDDADHQPRTAAAAPSNDAPGNELAAVLGANLRRLRSRSGLSLEKLASLSGVSRGMIGRIEMGRSTPTIGLLSLLAEALDVQLVSLIAVRELPAVRVLRHGRSTTIETSGGKFIKRPLSGRQAEGAEFFELAIAPGHVEAGDRQAPGTTAHVVVGSGTVVVTVAGEQPAKLTARDAIVFSADAEHSFHNVGDREAILYASLSGSTTGA
jgi:transcriptional regulator with XRE-family HTH domain